MKRINSRFESLLFVFMLMAALVLSFTPIEARADIDEIIIGVGVDADTLNPQEQTTTLFQNWCDLIYGNFIYQDPEGKLHPRLATSMDVSDDGLTWTLHLRKGVKFSDGTDFNADAVKLTWDRILNPKAAGAAAVCPRHGQRVCENRRPHRGA